MDLVKATPWGQMPDFLGRWIGDDPARRAAFKTRLVQALVVTNLLLGARYIVWRSAWSVNWDLWPLGIALLGAELFSFTDSLLFGMNMWRVRHRGEPVAPAPELAVDVFITTYNEPISMVLETAAAAIAITYPHRTWILDDGNRPELRAAAERLSVGYLVRNSGWTGKDRHAKAGNVINAMYETAGEFILILDADQVPRPEILDRVLGYFSDPKVAFVQTPQWFHNTPAGDPFGTDAPLFYGPIQAGKDGWNSAFFCGSNAVLRREALMHIGLLWYTRQLDLRVRAALRSARPLLRRARRRLGRAPDSVRAIDEVMRLVETAKRGLEAGEAMQAVTWDFQRGIDRHRTPVEAIEEVQQVLAALDMDHRGEAEPVLPIATVSITEDMATAMRLHSAGWTSVYHHEILAVGLAPEDLHTALQQRLRWAQGTLQVMLRENPLVQPGLSIAQRLLYFGTMWSYLSGFASVVYLGAPMVYLVFGLSPVASWSGDFFAHLLPALIANQVLFMVIGWGLATFRGQQYSLALFPLWLTAVWTTIGNVWLGRKLGFVVTPKTRQGGIHLRLVWPQLLAMALLVVSVVIGFTRLALGWTEEVGPIVINAVWALYDVAMLSVVLVAATWKPPAPGPVLAHAHA